MSDLISRQAAIDAMGRATWAINRINELPSAQPETHEERTETHACDCISRQAVIEAINKIFPADPMRDDYTQGITCGAALANIYVAQLPSAQPQRKSGKWIKHIDNLFPAESTLECNVCHHEQPITIDDNFCPNCGADMREDGEADADVKS